MSKITVSLPSSLLTVLDRLAHQWATTRSGTIAELLRRAEQEELERELAEGYTAWAKVNKQEAEVFIPAQSEVIMRG